MTAYTLLMDLLFKSGRYQDVVDLFVQLKKDSVLDVKFPRDIMCLAQGSAYVINTPETFAQAKEWATEARQQGSVFSIRAISFFAANSVKHSQPELGYELMSQLRMLTSLPRNIKILILSKMKRPDDALLLIRGYLSADRGDKGFKGEFSQEALEAMTQAVTESNQKELATELEQVMRALREGNHISSRSLEEMLMEPIELSRRALESRNAGPQHRYQNPDERRDEGNRSYDNRGYDRSQFRGGYGSDRGFDRGSDRGSDRGFDRNRGDDRGYGRQDDRRGGFDRRPRDQGLERRGLRELE